jgi:hypothetical protein
VRETNLAACKKSFKPDRNGKTRLRFEVKTKYLGFLPRLFEPFITPAANKKLNEDLQRMKQLLDAEPKAN